MDSSITVREEYVSIPEARILLTSIRECGDMFSGDQLVFRTTGTSGVDARVFKRSVLGRHVSRVRRLAQLSCDRKLKICTIIKGRKARRKKPSDSTRVYIVFGGTRTIGGKRVPSRAIGIVSPGRRCDIGAASTKTIAPAHILLELK